MNPDNPEQTNGRIFYIVGVLAGRNFLARLTEIAAKPHSHDCRVIVYEFREDIVEQILQQLPNVLILETETSTFDAAQVAKTIGSDVHGQNTALILLIPIRVQHTHNLTKYIARYGKKVAFFLMLPFAPIELEQKLVVLIHAEERRVKTCIVQMLEDEVGRMRSISGN